MKVGSNSHVAEMQQGFGVSTKQGRKELELMGLAKISLRQARVCIGHLRSPGRSSTQAIPHYDRLMMFFKADLFDDLCWEWSGSCSSGGLPKITCESTTTSLRVRRLIWELFIGPLCGGLHPGLTLKAYEVVSSTCGSEVCVRPTHLIKKLHVVRPPDTITYRGIGPRNNLKPRSEISIGRYVQAESVIGMKRQGLTNTKVASILSLSLTTVERIISGSSFPHLSRTGLRESIQVHSRLNQIASHTKYKTEAERRAARASQARRYRSTHNNSKVLPGMCAMRVSGAAQNG